MPKYTFERTDDQNGDRMDKAFVDGVCVGLVRETPGGDYHTSTPGTRVGEKGRYFGSKLGAAKWLVKHSLCKLPKKEA